MKKCTMFAVAVALLLLAVAPAAQAATQQDVAERRVFLRAGDERVYKDEEDGASEVSARRSVCCSSRPKGVDLKILRG